MGFFMQTVAPGQAARKACRVRGEGRQGGIRLLLITDTDLAQKGGSERFLSHLLEGLDPTLFRIDLIQLNRCDAAHKGDGLAPISNGRWGIEYHPIGAIYSPRALKVWRQVYARVREGRYDIVQSQHEKSDLLVALLPNGPNRPLRISNRRDTGFQKSRALRLLFLLINHRFDRIVAPAEAILAQLVAHEGVSRLRTRCLPNGVDCERFAPLAPDLKSAGRIRAGLPEHDYLVGCVARLVPVKRHEDLIAGFSMVAQTHTDARLVLVGDGPLRQTIERQVEATGLSGRVIFMGEGRDMEQLLPLLDAFALVSSTEGMSNAILEAMACALPVVATNVGGNPELIQPAVTGYLVPPFQAPEVAIALSDLLERRDHGRRLGQAARERALASFSLPAMIDAFSNFYRDGRGVVGA